MLHFWYSLCLKPVPYKTIQKRLAWRIAPNQIKFRAVVGLVPSFSGIDEARMTSAKRKHYSSTKATKKTVISVECNWILPTVYLRNSRMKTCWKDDTNSILLSALKLSLPQLYIFQHTSFNEENVKGSSSQILLERFLNYVFHLISRKKCRKRSEVNNLKNSYFTEP